MRLVRCAIVLFCFLSAFQCFAQKEDWLPITPDDLNIKEVKGDPGASAIQLYYADYIDDTSHSEFFYNRIKILTEKGKEHADVEIPVFPQTSIAELKARTIQPDGRVVDFSGKPFEKTIIKGRGVKYLAKTFTLPEVSVGSIIEYKYKVIMPEYVVYNNTWIVQHDLYTVKESFRMKPYEGRLETKGGESQLSMLSTNMPNDLKPRRKSWGFEMDAQNMPAFHGEDYMPPEENYKPEVHFFYGGGEIASPEKFWQDAGREWNNDAEQFIGNHAEIKAAAAEALGSESDPEKQLQKLYERAQQIRNLSYERARTEQEEKKESLKRNQNVVDVLKRGYGYSSDITLFFVALARAQGFQASLVQASNRKEHFFNQNLLSSNQLEHKLAVVKVSDKDVYLDPGTRLCPYGFVRWMYTSTAGLKLDKKGGSLIQIPPATQDKAVTKRNANLTLAADGTLSGDLTVQFQGGEALEHRLDALETDEAGRKKALEDELSNLLPPTAVVNMTKAQGRDAEEQPLLAEFHIQIPGYASAAGKRLQLPPYLFQSRKRDAFKPVDRKYPVYFPYAFGESDVIMIKFPAGYSMEGNTQNEDAALGYARYVNRGQFDGSQLALQRVLLFNGIFFDLKVYSEVRDFFNKVQTADEQQVVLRAGAATSAAKSN
jgi:hypothetical protein